MIVDLSRLTWYQAFTVLNYCIENKIDLTSCERIINNYHSLKYYEYCIDIPEKHMTWLMLKFF